MTFTALVVDKQADGAISQSIQSLNEDRLPDGEVTVSVSHSTLNYKDGLCLTGKGGLVRKYPHVPGIDFAGVVTHSLDARYKPGDEVVLTGWRVGEAWWGGYATKARVAAGWLVPMPQGMSARHAMAFGTAGLTAMLGIMALEGHGLQGGQGDVLVTGATGGVGSIAVLLLSRLGYRVAAITGRPEHEQYLTSLGAAEIISRQGFLEDNPKPLESERWLGVIDTVGGDILGRLLKQVRFGGSVAAIGLAGGAQVPSFTIIPFLLRGINLLGIDSVSCPFEKRVEAWRRLGDLLPLSALEPMIEEYKLEDLPRLGEKILQGRIKGRSIINVAASAS